MSDQLRIGAIEAGGTKMVLAIGTIKGEIVEREVLPTEEPEIVNGSRKEIFLRWA